MRNNSDWTNGTRSDILYTPRLALATSLPPILIEVQKRVDQKFMARLCSYSLNVFFHYKVHPIVIVFCVEKVAGDVKDTFEAVRRNDYLFETVCHHWTKKCYLISNETINYSLNSTTEDDFDSLLAIQYFLGSQQRNIMALNFYNDPAIALLYEISKREFEVWVESSNTQIRCARNYLLDNRSPVYQNSQYITQRAPFNK